MANPVDTNVRRAAGRLCIGPTNLATAYPHGGTALGLVSEVRLVGRSRQFVIRAGEYGGEATEVVHLGRDWLCICLIKGWDDDTLSTLFPNTAAGGSSGNLVISEPGGTNPGSLLSGRAVVLCYTPFTATDPGFLVYRAIPNLQASVRMEFAAARELGFIAVFRGVRDASGRVVQIGQTEDLTL